MEVKAAALRQVTISHVTVAAGAPVNIPACKIHIHTVFTKAPGCIAEADRNVSALCFGSRRSDRLTPQSDNTDPNHLHAHSGSCSKSYFPPL